MHSFLLTPYSLHLPGLGGALRGGSERWGQGTLVGGFENVPVSRGVVPRAKADALGKLKIGKVMQPGFLSV